MSERRQIQEAARVSEEAHSLPLHDRVAVLERANEKQKNKQKMLHDRVAVLEELLDGVTITKGLFVPPIRYAKPKEESADNGS